MLIKISRFYLVLSSFLLISACNNAGERSFSIIGTTDLHGVILPYDFIENEPLNASLANSASYIRQVKSDERPLFLLDNGDNLQGQPAVYYYNFVDTISPHFLSEAMNWLEFDAGTVGNHDIEAGHDVYDRLSEAYNFPLLAANAVDKKSGEPYFTPFVILEKNKIRIAVMGLITPAVPTWLPEELYSGIEFRDMVETAAKWMPEIMKQKPDLVVGLFHSGWNREDTSFSANGGLNENGSAAVAYNVPGFDIIFCGHDHRLANEKFADMYGDSVMILNGGSKSLNLVRADVSLKRNWITGKRSTKISGRIIDVKDYEPDPDFVRKFAPQEAAVKLYVNKVIGNSAATISSRDAYFGSSAFIDMIHKMQLEITGADVSFAAPLSFDVEIAAGPVTVADMFKLYRFENMLYTMGLTGAEIRKYLEFSYGGWLNTMKHDGDYLLKYRLGKDGKPILTENRAWLRNQSYNFDSAAGIEYIVDASKPEGSRITIRGLTRGGVFDDSKTYRVALNSYRGNGGGGLLVEGAGIKIDDLKSRVISSTDRDLRYYIIQYIGKQKTVNPQPLNNWKIIPENWVGAASSRERILLFGKE